MCVTGSRSNTDVGDLFGIAVGSASSICALKREIPVVVNMVPVSCRRRVVVPWVLSGQDIIHYLMLRMSP